MLLRQTNARIYITAPVHGRKFHLHVHQQVMNHSALMPNIPTFSPSVQWICWNQLTASQSSKPFITLNYRVFQKDLNDKNTFPWGIPHYHRSNMTYNTLLDGAPCHCHRNVRNFLNETFPASMDWKSSQQWSTSSNSTLATEVTGPDTLWFFPMGIR